MPEITVIVPVYNVEPYLHRCVDSILAQTYTDFELILVDDGSPDNCPAICDAYAAQDERVKVIHQQNGGLSAARNAGIDWAFANSDSQWLTFIDSDDWVHKEYLERLLDAAVTHNVRVSLCGFERTEGANADVPETMSFRLSLPEDFYVQDNVTATIACAKLYRKSCFEGIRYPIGKIHEDEFVTYQILFSVPEIAVIEDKLYYYFINENGITKAKWRPERLQALEAMKNQIDYMKQNGYQQAHRHAIKKYVTCVSSNLVQATTSKCKSWKQYRRKLIWKLRWLLLRYHKLVPLNDFPWVYESAFSYLMYVYWIVRAQMNKIQKVLFR